MGNALALGEWIDSCGGDLETLTAHDLPDTHQTHPKAEAPASGGEGGEPGWKRCTSG